MRLGPSDSGAYDAASARKAGGAAHVACSLVSPLLGAVRARLILSCRLATFASSPRCAASTLHRPTTQREPLRPRLHLFRPCAVALQRGVEVRRDLLRPCIPARCRQSLRLLGYSCPNKSSRLRPRLGVNRAPHGARGSKEAMGFEDDLRRIEEHVAEARRLVQRQKGLIIRLRAGSSTWDAQRILSLLESNLRRLEEHRDRLRDQQN